MKNPLTHTYYITLFEHGRFCWKTRVEKTGFRWEYWNGFFVGVGIACLAWVV